MEELWYALGCLSPRKELSIRDDARRQGFQAFVPLKYEIRTLHHQRHRALVPAMAGLMFIRGTLDQVKEYVHNARFLVYLRKSTFSDKRDYLTVSLSAMENFIAVTENNEEHITYFRPDEITLHEGDKIRVKGGIYDGCEGVIMRIKGKRNRHLVVQIPGVVFAAVEMSPSMIELRKDDAPSKRAEAKNKQVELRERKSKNIDKDKALLFNHAHRLLFEIPNKYQNENEYYLLLSETRRLVARLSGLRGFTPATEAEFALPLYLAAVKLDEGVAPAQQRLQKVIQALKPISLLRLRCQLFLAVLSSDASLLADVRSAISSWSKPYSPKQQSLFDELNLIAPAK